MKPGAPRGRRARRAGGARTTSTAGSTFAAIYALVRQVPAAHVVTYGEVARLVGLTRGARAVGWALRALSVRTAPRVPWHRVVGHGGRISLGQSPGGQEQRRRLRREGVRFRGDRVDLERHAWVGAEVARRA